jgi:hypothetical protein
MLSGAGGLTARRKRTGIIHAHGGTYRANGSSFSVLKIGIASENGDVLRTAKNLLEHEIDGWFDSQQRRIPALIQIDRSPSP